MKYWSLFLFLVFALPNAKAQNLSGTWQGVELHLPRMGFWPALLTIREAADGSITGELDQESSNNAAHTVRFQIDGRHAGSSIRLDQTRILYENTLGNSSWCQGYVECTYDAREERLSGRTTFRPVNGCSTSTFELFRVKLKSAASVPAGTWSTLRVSGREVTWFADPDLHQPVAKGNDYRTRLNKTTTFYIVQGFYPSQKSGPVPVTVRVVPASSPQPARALPLARPASAPVQLPAVLFQTGTAQLLPAAQPTLNQLLKELLAQPKRRLRIAGHTDNIGDAAKNTLLSEQRAAAVRAFLIEGGIAENRLEAVGYGHSRLLYPSPDPRNRRVEIETLH
jgi:outer membrane protein OmpA-like peptidoglycan-associated protein